MAPVPARQGLAAGAHGAPVRLLPLLPPSAVAAGDGSQRVVGSGRRRRQEAAPVPVLLCRHPPRPRAVAGPRRRRGRGRDARATRVRPAARVHARHHHRRRPAAARGPLLRLRPEPRALHRLEPPAAHAAVPRPRPGRRPHVRLHGPPRHQPHRARGGRPRRAAAAAAAVPVLHHPRPLRHPLPGLVLLGLAGDAHRAVEPGVQEHQAGGQAGEMAGQGADGVLEGQPRRVVAAATRAARMQRHQPLASRDHAPKLGGGSQVRVPELQALQPVHSPVQDLRRGVRVVGEPQVHPVVRVHGAAHRPAVRGLLQPGAGPAGELLAGERRRHVRADPGRRGLGQRAPGGGGARRQARAAADAGAGHGRRLRLHAAPAHGVRRAARLPAGAAAHGAGGVRGVRSLPRRRATEEVPGGVRSVAGDGRAMLHAAVAAATRQLICLNLQRMMIVCGCG